MTITALLLTVLSSGFSTAPVAVAAQDTLAIYDLAAIASPERAGAEGHDWLLPFFRPHSNEMEEFYLDEGESSLLVDELHSFVVSLLGDEFEFEGRAAELLEDGTMLVSGPPSLHARLRSLLAFLDSVLNARVELTVDLFRAPEGQPSPRASELTLEEAQAFLQKRAGTGQRETLVLSLPANRETVVDLTQEHSVLMGYTVEVAERSAIHDPLVRAASFGTRLGIKATPAKDGVALALSLRRGDLLRGLEGSEVGLAREFALDADVKTSRSPDVVQELEIANRSWALNSLLREGHALLLSSRVQVASGWMRDLILIRRTGGGLPLFEAMADEPGLPRLTVLNAEALSPARRVAEGQLLAVMESPGDMQMLWEGTHMGPFLATRLEQADSQELMGVVLGSIDPLSTEHYGPWTFLVAGRSADAGSSSAAISSSLERFGALAESSELIDLSLTVRRQGTPALEVGHVRLPLRVGQSSGVVLGMEGLTIVDYDVEIAKHAAAPSPVIATLFDGLALWLLPRRTPSGRLSLELRGGVHLETHRSRTDLRSTVYDWIEQRGYDQLLVNERVLFAAGGGPETIVLGGSGGGSPGVLRIELTLGNQGSGRDPGAARD